VAPCRRCGWPVQAAGSSDLSAPAVVRPPAFLRKESEHTGHAGDVSHGQADIQRADDAPGEPLFSREVGVVKES
jgi:hypothetical protein